MNTRLIAAIAASVLLAGCATPGYHDSSYYDRGYPRYATSPSPAPVASSGSYLPQAVGAVAGGLLGAQVGKGNGRIAAAAAGSAIGAYAGGRLSDPCQSELNMGHAVGGLAGALLGSQVGRGNGRTATAAAGAAMGAIMGGNLGGRQAPVCR